MLCNHCSALLEPKAKYCSQCGQSTSKDQITNIPSQSHAKKAMPLWFKGLLSLVILVIGGFIMISLFSEDLTDTVKDQLTAIRANQITEAYYNFTSKEFQETTTLERFHEFIKKHPAFSENHSVYFNDRNVNNGRGILEAVMTTTQNQKTLVEYTLIEQGDKWKIFTIKVREEAPPAVSQRDKDTHDRSSEHDRHIEFKNFATGNSVDSKGIIKTASNLFKSDSGDIYLNLYVQSDEIGSHVKISFEHIDSQSALSPISTQITDKGNSILSFVFSPPQSGWPKGNYRILAEASSDNQSSFDFKVE